MCVQIKLIPRNVIDEIIQLIEIDRPINYMPDWPAQQVSAFPNSEVGIIVSESRNMVSVIKKWGYPVSWSKQVIVNTREDSALNPDKMWFDSIQRRRCIIPTFGFYEPHQAEKTISARTGKPIKQQYFFESPDCPVTFIAGIYEEDHFSMMTTKPNDSMKPIHHRMPIVLSRNELNTWLNGDFQSLFDRSEVKLTASRV